MYSANCISYIGHYNEAKRILNGKEMFSFSKKKVYSLVQVVSGIALTYYYSPVVIFLPDGNRSISLCGYPTNSTRNVINTQLTYAWVNAVGYKTVLTDAKYKKYIVEDRIILDSDEVYVSGATPQVRTTVDRKKKNEAKKRLAPLFLAIDTINILNRGRGGIELDSLSINRVVDKLTALIETYSHTHDNLNDMQWCLETVKYVISIAIYNNAIIARIKEGILDSQRRFWIDYLVHTTLPIGEI